MNQFLVPLVKLTWIAGVSFLALIFDLNYQYSCNYVYQQDHITKLVKRLNYQNSDTFKKMLNIMNHANEYLKEKSDLNN